MRFHWELALGRSHVISVVVVGLVLLGAVGPSVVAAQSGGLRIVVLEGEDAVNIVQQKSAVAPVVEVRDRNDQPVAGAIVRFTIRNGRATFNGARTLSVTTNAAGRAAVSGLTPTGSGALQIGAAATFQGQSATLVIAQTNVMTVAEAGQVAAGATAGGSGTGGAGAAGGAASGSGGGAISATTIGVIGGAVAGGTILVKEVQGGGTLYRGPYSGVMTMAYPSVNCTRLQRIDGTLTMELDVSNSSVSADADAQGTSTATSISAACTGGTALGVTEPLGCCASSTKVSGSPQSFGFNTSDSGNPGATITWQFAGALSGDVISGTLTITVRDLATNSVSFAVTLTKQQ